MDFATYYEELKSVSSELLRERATSEEYTEEYKKACKKILEERADGSQQEPILENESIPEEEPLSDLDREVPTSFDECYKSDKVSEALYDLSIGVKNWGYVLFAILLIAGVVLSVMGSFVTYTEVQEGLYDTYEIVKEEFDAGIFFANIVSWIIYAGIEFGACKVISLLLTALASIVRSNRITSNVALYNASKEK